MKAHSCSMHRLVRQYQKLAHVAFAGLLICLASCLAGCGVQDMDQRSRIVVFRHAKMFGDPRPLDELLARFEHESGLKVIRETLPASSDEQHLFYAINLQAASQAFDLMAIDVIWLAEFARAGWLRDLSHLVDNDARGDFFPGVLAAATWRGSLYALPWFSDAGLLYYRKDLLAKYGLSLPQTWQELTSAARTITRHEPNLYGFVWQGKQYEGLVCNALEFIWSHGGDPLNARAYSANRRGLDFMRDLVTQGISPSLVSTLTEEPARIIFGRGRAVFLRNWPYAWHLFEREGSAVRGKVGVMALPHAHGAMSAAALGGWLLGVNAYSPRADAAADLARFLSSRQAHKALALAYGYSPPRRSLYADSELLATQPILATLKDVLERSRPRPVSSRYVDLSQSWQAQFSAVLTGVQTPDDALAEMAASALRGGVREARRE